MKRGGFADHRKLDMAVEGGHMAVVARYRTLMFRACPIELEKYTSLHTVLVPNEMLAPPDTGWNESVEYDCQPSVGDLRHETCGI